MGHAAWPDQRAGAGDEAIEATPRQVVALVVTDAAGPCKGRGCVRRAIDRRAPQAGFGDPDAAVGFRGIGSQHARGLLGIDVEAPGDGRRLQRHVLFTDDLLHFRHVIVRLEWGEHRPAQGLDGWPAAIGGFQVFLKLVRREFCDAANAVRTAIIAECLAVGFRCGVSVLEAEHDLVLIERAGIGVHLVDHEDVFRLRVVAQIGVKMLFVVADGPFDVAVVGGHGDGPRLTGFGIDPVALGILRGFDGDVEALEIDVALAVVRSADLPRRRFGIHPLAGAGEVFRRFDFDGLGRRASARRFFGAMLGNNPAAFFCGLIATFLGRIKLL
jgi:hypothetical protein